MTPITGSGWNGRVGDAGPPDRSRMTWINGITPGWFRAMDIRILSGRDFEQNDRIGATKVAVINETFARRFLVAGPPVGQRVRVGGPGDATSYRIVGLVSDAVYRSLREGMVPTMYVPLAQEDRIAGGITMTVATMPGARSGAERVVSEALHQIDPGLSFTFGNFDEFLRALTTQERLVAMLSGFFGGLALLLAVLGLYGVVSHSVHARRAEIGVRMALGASGGAILRLVLKRVGLLLTIGLVGGLSLSLWVSQFVQSLLFQLDAQDPATLSSAVLVLAAAGVLAAWLPARRAARLDPGHVLREN